MHYNSLNSTFFNLEACLKQISPLDTSVFKAIHKMQGAVWGWFTWLWQFMWPDFPAPDTFFSYSWRWIGFCLLWNSAKHICKAKVFYIWTKGASIKLIRTESWKENGAYSDIFLSWKLELTVLEVRGDISEIHSYITCRIPVNTRSLNVTFLLFSLQWHLYFFPYWFWL